MATVRCKLCDAPKPDGATGWIKAADPEGSELGYECCPECYAKILAAHPLVVLRWPPLTRKDLRAIGRGEAAKVREEEPWLWD